MVSKLSNFGGSYMFLAHITALLKFIRSTEKKFVKQIR